MGILLVGLRGPLVIHVGEGHEVLAGQAFDVGRPLPADADAGDVELLAGRDMLPAAQNRPRNDACCRRRAGDLQNNVASYSWSRVSHLDSARIRSEQQ